MDRQQAAILIAKINKLNKDIAYRLDSGKTDDFISEFPDIQHVEGWCLEVKNYMMNNHCHSLILYLHDMISIEVLHVLYKEKKEHLSDSTISLFNRYFLCLMDLYNLSSDYTSVGKDEKYKLLEDVFANDKAIEIFNRMIDAGLLNKEYKLAKDFTRPEIKALAWGIGRLLNIEKKVQWVSFEKQWRCCKLGCISMPANSQGVEVIMQQFPNVDFAPLLNIKRIYFFVVPFSDSRIEELFMSLLTYGYIDKGSKLIDFFKIMSRGKDLTAFQPINWITNVRSLSYFINLCFSPTNKDFWIKAACCFKLKGHAVNKNTLVNQYSFIKRNNIEVDNCIKSICEQFNK